MSSRKLRDGLAAGIKDKSTSGTAARNRFDRADEVLGLESEPPASAHSVAMRGNVPEPVLAPAHLAAARVVREIFSMPAPDSELLEVVRDRCKSAGAFVSKSEIVRAGLHALAALSTEDILALVGSLEKRRPGRRRRVNR